MIRNTQTELCTGDEKETDVCCLVLFIEFRSAIIGCYFYLLLRLTSIPHLYTR